MGEMPEKCYVQVVRVGGMRTESDANLKVVGVTIVATQLERAAFSRRLRRSIDI